MRTADKRRKEMNRDNRKDDKHKHKKIEVVFIMDRSGSMGGLEADTIGGFNSMLKKQKEEEEEAPHYWMRSEERFITSEMFTSTPERKTGRFGINANRAANYECDGVGTNLNYSVLSATVSKMRKSKCSAEMSAMLDSEDCLAEIRQDYQRRGQQ